jgi:GPH family glycoside/pentoside/hexuronide:cation symporter
MSQSAEQTPATGNGLKLREYVGYALGDTASNFFFQTFTLFLTYYYVDVWGIPGAVLLWMMPLIKLIDAVNDPAMGLIADRTNTRWGKYRPYMLWGAIPYGICGYLLFAGPGYGETGKIVYAFITYMLMLMSYTVINVPYSSILGVISPSSRTRAVASSWRFVGAFGGGFMITLFVWPLVQILGKGADGKVDEMQGFQWAMAIFAVASVILFWISFATTNERVTPPPKQKTNVKEELKELVRNRPWVILLIASIFSTTFLALRGGSTIFYFKYVTCDAYTPVFFKDTIFKLDRFTVFLASGFLAQMVGMAGLGFFVRRLDKKYAAATFSAVTGVCFMLFFFLPYQYYWLLVAVNVLGYLCMGPASTLVWALYGDVADYGEWKFRRRSTGLVYSASLFSIKTGLVVGGFLLLWFLGQYGFDKDATEQTTRAAYGILLAFSIVPGVFALLKAGAFLIYPLNQKRVDEIERELAARHAAESTETEAE